MPERAAPICSLTRKEKLGAPHCSVSIGVPPPVALPIARCAHMAHVTPSDLLQTELSRCRFSFAHSPACLLVWFVLVRAPREHTYKVIARSCVSILDKTMKLLQATVSRVRRIRSQMGHTRVSAAHVCVHVCSDK